MPTRIKARNDTAALWTAANPIMAKGEIGLETDTNQFKFGDGVRTWSALPYAAASGGTVPADVLRNTTAGVLLFQSDNSVVGAAFTVPGFYLRGASGWTMPSWLQQQTFERFAITAFPYTLTQADAELGMIFLQPAANAVVNLPNAITTSPSITNVRTYLDVVFYLDSAVTVTFTPTGGTTLQVPGTAGNATNFPLTGPHRAVVIQARSNSYRVLD